MYLGHGKANHSCCICLEIEGFLGHMPGGYKLTSGRRVFPIIHFNPFSIYVFDNPHTTTSFTQYHKKSQMIDRGCVLRGTIHNTT